MRFARASRTATILGADTIDGITGMIACCGVQYAPWQLLPGR
jgi:hypothetical protein